MRSTPVSRSSILIVDDEKIVRESLRLILKGDNKLHLAANAREALSRFQQHPIDLVFLDILLPDMNGIDLLGKLKQIKPATRIIMVTAVQDVLTAVDAMKAGAFDFLPKPFDVDRVRTLTARALIRTNERVHMDGDHCFEGMVGRDAAMRRVFKTIESVSACDGTVLIQGRSGTGKELVARAVHNRSARAPNPYVVINCGAMPATLMESELFGHCRGAFTGAFIDCPGKIETAHTGSLFLDEINCLSLEMQAKLLRVIQHKEFERLGSHRPIKADIRIIAATNKPLNELVEAGQFREDLYYRLNVLPIDLPRLRHRGKDIGLLLEHFLKRNASRNAQASKRFSPRASDILMRYNWPGNVRELENLVERLCTLHKGRTIRAADLQELQSPKRSSAFNGQKLKKATRAFERQHILAALKAFDGSRSQAARHLGIHRNTLLMKTKALGIEFR